MRFRRKRKVSPLRNAISLFVSGVVFLVLAFMPPLSGVDCSSGVCINYVYTFYGMDENVFKIVCGVAAVLCIIGGVYFLYRHNQAQAALKSSTVYSGSQPFPPQQPGAYPPPQNIYPQGSYTGNAQPQQPSND